MFPAVRALLQPFKIRAPPYSPPPLLFYLFPPSSRLQARFQTLTLLGSPGRCICSPLGVLCNEEQSVPAIFFASFPLSNFGFVVPLSDEQIFGFLV
jgi:hypothetical protein